MIKRLRIPMVVAVAALLLAAGAPAAAPATTTASTTGPLVRKNVKELTAQERADYVAALLALRAERSPYDKRFSYYDQFVEWHLTLYRCNELAADNIDRGHNGPFFLPWHRAFVLLLERALQQVSGKPIAVPYWDWTDPASTASVFTNDFMGGDGDPLQGYAVTSGPFRKGKWRLKLRPEGAFWAPSATTYLTRRFGSGGPTALPPAADVAWALQAPSYDVAPFDMSSDPNTSFRNALEGWWRSDPSARLRFADPVDHSHCGPDQRGIATRDAGKLHNQVHSWTGGILATTTGGTPTVFGTMLLPTSPNDPTFFLHHANIDRLWAQWQVAHGGAGIEPAASANTNMQPFLAEDLVYSPTSVNRIDGLGYTYSNATLPGAVAPASLTAAASTTALASPSPTVSFRCPVRR